MANEATLEMIVRAQDQATRTLKQTESLLRSLGGAVTGGVTAPFRVASGVVGGFVRGMGQIGLAAMGIKATVGAVKALTGGLIAGNAEFERYQTQFEVLLGSADAAKKKLEELAEFGQTTPFELPEVVRASKTLQVFGGEALNSAENLRLVGDIAAGVGRPFENVAFWVGRLYSNLKGGRPIGEAAMALQEMGALSGEARTKLEEMAKAGASADEIFRVFAETMGQQFGGMMEKQSQTFEGMMSNLVDWWDNTKRIIAEPIFDVVKQNLSTLLDFLGSEQVQQATQKFAEWLAQGVQTAIDWGNMLVGWFRENWPTIQAISEQVFTAVQAAIDQVRPAITSIIDTANQVISYMEANWPHIYETIATTLANIQVVVNESLMQIRTWWFENNSQVLATVQATLTDVQTFISNALAFIKQETSGALGFLNQWWHEHGESIRIIAEFILNLLSDVFNRIVSLFRSTGDEQTSIWRRVWDDIKTILKSVLGIIGGILDAFAALIKGDWNALGKALEDIWRNVWTIVKTILIGAKDALVAIVRSLVSAMQTAFTNVDWSSIGHAIVDGVAAGVRAGAGAIADAARAAAQAALDAAKSLLGIHSPSRVFMELGEQTIQGFVQGLLKNMSAITSAIRQTFEKVSDESVKQIRNISNMLSAAGRAVAEAIRAITAVADFDVEKTAVGGRGLEKARWVARRMAKILQELSEVIRVEWVQEAAKLTAAHSENIRKALEPIRVVVDAIKSVASIDVEETAVGLRSGEKATWVARRMAEILRQLDAVIRVEWVQEAARSVAANAEEVRKALAPVRVIVEAIKEVASLNVKETAVGLRAGNKAYWVARRMAEILRQLGEVAQVEWVQNAARYAADLAENAQSAMKLVTTAVDALNIIADYEPAKDLKEKMEKFQANVEMFFAGILAIRENAGNDALPAAKTLQEIAASIHESVTAAIDSLRAVVEGVEGLEGAPALFRQFINAFQRFVDSLQRVGYDMGRAWLIGIENGLRSRLDNLENLLEYIRGLFPSSPAKRGPFRTLPDWGALLNGFDEALALATTGARELAAVPSPAFAAACGSTGMVGRGSGNIVVNITYSPGISLADRREVEERIAPLIEEALRRAQRKRL